MTVTTPPITVPYSSSPQTIPVTALVQFGTTGGTGSTVLTSGMVTFSLVPLGGGTPVATVTTPIVNNGPNATSNVSTRITLPAALPPGSYTIVATVTDGDSLFTNVVATNAINVTGQPPNRSWSR